MDTTALLIAAAAVAVVAWLLFPQGTHGTTATTRSRASAPADES